ncbi:uncharacterized protein DEA37_0005036 [Paragonimus westermani]|uniref:Uncharacterized protein n=1 Tax=Paragonimus westermani TaxID=34504 RepID=A0A5J4P0P5_9TREM|nr:uncharacterized protein DEA37_0005036 [Paragonimus westermani]
MPLSSCVKQARRSPSQVYKKSTGMLADLPDAVADRMPFNCSIQGVGISGPCKTPDYVPASHFINKSPQVTTASFIQPSADVTKPTRIRDCNEYPTANPTVPNHLGVPVGQPQISDAESYIDIQVAVPKELATDGIRFVTCPQVPGFIRIIITFYLRVIFVKSCSYRSSPFVAEKRMNKLRQFVLEICYSASATNQSSTRRRKT